jgi:hypothetical protein
MIDEPLAHRTHSKADAVRVLTPPRGGSLRRLDNDLEALCLSFSETFADEHHVSLTLTSDPVLLNARRSWQASLIAWELMTDAMTRAASGFGDRTIEVSARIIVGFLVIAVRDHAPGRLADGGRSLVTAHALAADLGATLVSRRTRNGFGAVLSFPFAEARAV